MLVTLLDQIYILLTGGIVGSFALRRLGKGNGTDSGLPAHFGSCVMCGLVILTAYAGWFSIFSGVGLLANIIMTAACLVFLAIDRHVYSTFLKDIALFFRNTNKILIMLKIVIFSIIVLICTYFTASGRFTYDTGTYHAQSIHWIESCGVVKGLAYMQTRLGFNSSYFCLCALYSFHFLGQSLHCVSGFLAAFVMTWSANGFLKHISAVCDAGTGKQFRLRVSDFLYIAPFAYFAITAIEIISPATDFGVIWMIMWLCIRWVELIEEERENAEADVHTGYILLCVMSVFLISVKLSVGVLVLLALKPAVLLIKEKNWKDVVKYVLMAFLLILPYFIRNYFITGWLVYPFPAVDIFSPDWKIPVDGVRYEADEVVVWARYTKDVSLIGQSIREWFPVWWEEQGSANRYLSLSAFAGAALMILRSLTAMVRRRTGDLPYIYFGMILFICFAFFMVMAPSNRFGYSYILMLPLFAVGDFNVNVIFSSGKSGILRYAAAFAVFILLCAGMLKGVYFFLSDDRHYVSETGFSGYPLLQKDYPEADCASKEWEGIELYYPLIEGEQIWYHAFPAILYEGNLDGIERRGPKIRDGFRLK